MYKFEESEKSNKRQKEYNHWVFGGDFKQTEHECDVRMFFLS